MEEVWKTIPDLPRYEISNKGGLRNANTGKHLKTRVTKLGYEAVTISYNKVKYFRSIHRLVAQAFIPNPQNKAEVNHIDENKLNNDISNLEWVSRKENLNHGTWIERKINANQKPIYAFKDGIGAEFKSTKQFATQYDINPTNVTQALKRLTKKGNKKTIKGFTFKYKE